MTDEKNEPDSGTAAEVPAPDQANPGAVAPESETLACGMCLQEKPPEVLVPVCSQCASKLELYIKHIMANLNEIVRLLYPKGAAVGH